MTNWKYKLSVLLITMVLVLLSCSRSKNSNPGISYISLKNTYPGKYLSLNSTNSRLFAVFSNHELENLSLFSIDIGKSLIKQHIKITPVDVIDTSPEINPFFGNHFFLITGSRMDLFYTDQQTEEKFILKWMSRKNINEPWSVNTLKPAGFIVAAIPYTGDRILSIWNSDKLYYRILYSKSMLEGSLNKQYIFIDDISVIANGNFYGFLSFERTTNSLMLFSFKNNKLYEKRLADFGRVQFASADKSGNINILAYKSKTNELIILNGRNSYFKQTKLTLARLTNSVYFFSNSRTTYYVYDEFSLDKKKRPIYQISLLFSKKGAFHKVILFHSKEEISKFKAYSVEGKLYILLINKGLKFIEILINKID